MLSPAWNSILTMSSSICILPQIFFFANFSQILKNMHNTRHQQCQVLKQWNFAIWFEKVTI